MRIKRRVFYGLIMSCVFLQAMVLPAANTNSLSVNNTAAITAISFVPNIETIGVVVSGTSLPPTAELSYRKTGESLWHSGHPLMRIDDGRLAGSLFGLSPSTSYEVKVLADSAEITGSINTQPDQLSFTPSVILHV